MNKGYVVDYLGASVVHEIEFLLHYWESSNYRMFCYLKSQAKGYMDVLLWD